MNQLAYGPSGTINGMTANVTDLGALRIRSDAIDAGKGLKWPLGTLKPGTYLLTESSGNLTDDNVYIAVFDQSGNRLQYVDFQNHANRTFTLREATDCTLGVYGKIHSAGKPCDIVLLPMLVDMKETVTAWQPPATLDAKAIGGGVAPEVNLLTNPGFEEGLAHWTKITSDANVFETDPNGANIRPHSGTRMLYVGAKSETFEIQGSVIHVSLWYTNAVVSRSLHVQMVFDDGTPQDLIQLWPADPPTIWKRYTATIKVPPNTTKARLIINTEFGRIDDVEVTEEI